MRYQAVILAAMAAGGWGARAESMPPPTQNALVQKYCAVCHTDAVRNGGLSLEHFDAAKATPDLVAMLLSKLNFGAMGASGIPKPDQPVIQALRQAFVTEAKGAADWSVERSEAVTTVSVVREAPRGGGAPGLYRVIATCNRSTQEGAIQVAWSPVAKGGTLLAAVDGNPATRYPAQSPEGAGLMPQEPAALVLSRLPLPTESLTVSGIFDGEAATFPFAKLPTDAREQLSGCFPNGR